MRQHKTFLMLIALVSVLSMASCGGSKSAGSANSSQRATVHIAQPARAVPSASAKMTCARNAQTEVAAVLGVRTTQPVVPTWTDHIYSCRYTYKNAAMVLSVKELSSKTETDAYFASLAHRLGQTERLTLGQGGFTAKNHSVVVRKDPSGRHLRTARPVWRAARQAGGHRGQCRCHDYGLLDRRMITQTGDAGSVRSCVSRPRALTRRLILVAARARADHKRGRCIRKLRATPRRGSQGRTSRSGPTCWLTVGRVAGGAGCRALRSS